MQYTVSHPTLVILMKSFSWLKLERKCLQNTMSLFRPGQTNSTAPSTENQKMQLPAFQINRPFQDNRHQAGLKNRRILPLDTGDYAPKCHLAGHQLKIKNSSKLDLLTSLTFSAFFKENISIPSLGSFWGLGFSSDTPPPLSTGPFLGLSHSFPCWASPGPKPQEITAYTQRPISIELCLVRNYIELDISRKRHAINAGSCFLAQL